MIEEEYTTQWLSELLFENGCKLESEWGWATTYKDSYYKKHKEYQPTKDDLISWLEHKSHWRVNANLTIPAHSYYSLLVTNAKEVFGEERCENVQSSCDQCPQNCHWPSYTRCGKRLLDLLQQGKREEAEKELWRVCTYNKSNQQ